jgi:hypothetical protein
VKTSYLVAYVIFVFFSLVFDMVEGIYIGRMSVAPNLDMAAVATQQTSTSGLLPKNICRNTLRAILYSHDHCMMANLVV